MGHQINIGAAVPRLQQAGLRLLGHCVLRLFGWRLQVQINTPRCVIIVAPHTSNWDFVFGMAAILALQIRVHWYAKHTLFQGWWGGFFRALGGFPVDRSAHGGVVAQTTQRFAQSETLMVGLAPEGTRSRVERWKRGFYHMAHAAQVPVVTAYIDYNTRVVGTGPVFTPTGDWAADLRPVFEFYRGIAPRRPENFYCPDAEDGG